MAENDTLDHFAARNPLSPRRRRWVTSGVMLGIFLAAIEQTVVATAMPTLVSSLGGVHIYSWVFSAYLLATTVSVPIWGRLADMYGRKRFYLASIFLFLLGSVLAGQSRSMAFLVFARAVQGFGSGGVFPIGSTILSDIYSLEQRARIQGLFSSIWGFASMVGPLAGGLITDLLSWRWVFYINVPFGIAAMLVIHKSLTEPERDKPRHSIDLGGVLSLSGSVSLLLLGLIRLGKGASLTEPALGGLFVGSALLLALFLRIEKRSPEPLLPVQLFGNRVFTVASAVGFFTGMGLFGSISFVPLFVQGVLNGSATRAGTSLTPLMLAWVILSAASGWLILKVGYRPLVVGGMAFLALGFGQLLSIGVATSYAEIWIAMGTLGIGMGLSMVTMLLGVQNSVSRHLIATATSGTIFFRTIGGTVGVAIMGAVMNYSLGVSAGRTDDESLRALAANPDSVVQEATRRAISPEALEWLRHALAEALQSVFQVGLIVALVALLVALGFPRGSARELAERREGEPA